MTTLVFAADAVLRARDGRMLIHTTSSPLPACQLQQPMLIGWLCQFMRPTAVEPALAALGPADRQAVMPVLDHLRRAGVLVEAGTDAANEPSADDADARSRRHLQTLARSVYELAADVLALGPYAEHAMRARDGSGVERRLLALLGASDNLRRDLASLRAPYLAEQAQRLGLDGSERGLKLHLGCGPVHLPDWINIDVHPAPLALNLRWGLPFDDGSAQRVYASHVLEHLFHPHDAQALLAEILRVLAPGGVVRLVVPDIGQCIEAYVANDRAFFDGRRETWGGWPQQDTRLADFLAYAGAGPDPGWLFEAHKYGYDEETLARALHDAGFTGIRRCGFMQSPHADLRIDDTSDTAAARYGDRHYSLFMEATRPAAP